ncbi:MAG: hypothetical protein AAFX44_02405 [Pseudomonadota bacterium]
MRNLVRISPTDRLDRQTFSYQSEVTDEAVDLGRYICPHCGHTFELEMRHFRLHEGTNFSNLNEIWRKHFDAFRAARQEAWESYLDFHCAGCRAPVRLIYEPDSKWAMGTHAWRITEIIEASAWPR